MNLFFYSNKEMNRKPIVEESGSLKSQKQNQIQLVE
jgi:hypothetical protein